MYEYQLVLDIETANIEVLKWLRDVASVRDHQTTQEKLLYIRYIDYSSYTQAHDLFINQPAIPGCCGSQADGYLALAYVEKTQSQSVQEKHSQCTTD